MTTAAIVAAHGQPGRVTPVEKPNGEAIVHRLFDVGYEIHLDRVVELLAPQGPERVRPARGEAQAIHIANPPVTVTLGTEMVTIAGRAYPAEVSARVFDFGVISMRVAIPGPADPSWTAFAEFGTRLEIGAETAALITRHLEALCTRIAGAIERPSMPPITEDYTVFRLRRLIGDDGAELPTETLTSEMVAPLLLGERRALSADARRELLPHRFTYYTDDLTLVTWTSALVVEPVDEDMDVQYVLEFANAQLLELRVYDAILDAELPRMYERIARTRPRTLVGRRFGRLLGDLQALVADVTETIERAENALKVTDDVYLSRIYAAAIETFRGRAWRRDIDRKLGIIRDTYEMLNSESQGLRAEVLEVAIVLLILIDIVIALTVR